MLTWKDQREKKNGSIVNFSHDKISHFSNDIHNYVCFHTTNYNEEIKYTSKGLNKQ